VKKAVGSESPGAEIALGATVIPMRKRTATWLQIRPHQKGKGQIVFDLTFWQKFCQQKKGLPAYLA
jgi:hypothetical protein